jgi:hypothetical protein
MSKKKLLSESQVRRFMGLAGMQSTIVSNRLNEMYGKPMEDEEEMNEMYGKPMEDEEEMKEAHGEPMEDEEPAEGMGMYEEEDEMPEPAGDDMPEPEGGPEMEISQEEADILAGVLEKLLAAKGDEEPMEPAEEPMEPAAEEPVEDEEVMEALDGVNLDLTEDEIVQEVARRVAKRVLKAKKANAELNEALGKK